VLHCVSSYPAPAEEINLLAMPLLAQELRCAVGYSDHTIGPEASLAAVALGARIIEKHFTLDKQFSDFRDHTLSADPAEMSALVQAVRKVTALRGKPIKSRQPCEAAVEQLSRRAIVAGADLPAGHRLTVQDLTWIRPPVGLPPGNEEQLLGRVLRRTITFGEPIRYEDVV
jgi:sialic acid synthase SpsE